MKNVLNSEKTFSNTDTFINVGNFASYFIFRIDVQFDTPFNNGNIILGTLSNTEAILTSQNIKNRIISISVDNVGLISDDIYLFLSNTSTEGSGTITIYYLYSNSFIKKTIDFADFASLSYNLGYISSSYKVSDILFFPVEVFDVGKISITNYTNTIIDKDIINLKESKFYQIEYHDDHISSYPFILNFEEFPTKGSFDLIIYYFPIKK